MSQNKGGIARLLGDKFLGSFARAERTQNILTFNHYERVRRVNHVLTKQSSEHTGDEVSRSHTAADGSKKTAARPGKPDRTALNPPAKKLRNASGKSHAVLSMATDTADRERAVTVCHSSSTVKHRCR
jgi:hypothetical protein